MTTTTVPQNEIIKYQHAKDPGGRTLHIYVIEGRFRPTEANSRRVSEFLTEAVATHPIPIATMRNMLNMCAVLVNCFEALKPEYHNQLFPFVAVPTTDGSLDESTAVYVGQALDLGLQVIDWCAAEVVKHNNQDINRPDPERQSLTILVSTAPLAAPFEDSADA